MTEKVYTVTDLGPGDGGKGGVVHKIATMMRAHTVVKVGGAQGSHGVSTSAGERFAFSQWGCGTLDGIRTHISYRMIILPIGLLNEAEALQYLHGIDAFALLTINETALCATPYHGIASRLKEMARGNNPRGTIGTGVGEAHRDLERHPQLAIYARDLSQVNLKDRLAAVREQIRCDLNSVIGGEFLLSDRAQAKKEIELLVDDGYLDYIEKRFRETSKRVSIVDPDYLRREIFSQDGVVVVESSHGVLTDYFYGFHPHTSALRTLPCFTHTMLKEAGYDGRVVNIAVHRAYQFRHGAGPMPTADPRMTENLLPGSHKQENRYQGKIRVGPIDLVLLRYAIEVCGGASAFDGLAITWFDQIQANGIWHICDHYHGVDDCRFFTPDGEIKIRHAEIGLYIDVEQLHHQEVLGKLLLSCKPLITSYKVPSAAERDNLYSLCADVLKEKVGIPVRMVSFGSTERDKICK
jgi:adenylosuccinate synthase